MAVFFRFKSFSFLALFFLSGLPLFSLDLAIKNIPDDSGLRARIKDAWMKEVPAKVLEKSPVLYNLASGGRLELRAEALVNEFNVILAHELLDVSGRGTGQFPFWAQGSWIITRDRNRGDVKQIKIFLRSDQFTYILFRPIDSERIYMDVILYNAYIRSSVTLPISMDRLYSMRLNELINVAGSHIPIKYFETDPQLFKNERALVSQIREGLPLLKFVDDGAIDENGNYVYIKTGLSQKGSPGLNCSGFTKWVIDQILFPVTGKYLTIEPLKAAYGQRGSSFTEPWEELREPFFGLDWIRNLASTAHSVLRSPAFANLDEIEVRAQPFSYLLGTGSSQSIISYPGFLEYAGYDIAGLLPLLYTIAIDEPGRFYLAAVNNERGPATTRENPRGRPRMRRFFHVAVLIPYFTENGVFQIAVFESAAETSFNSFRNRYPAHHVNLVRVPVPW